jgi:hypothetical protein
MARRAAAASASPSVGRAIGRDSATRRDAFAMLFTIEYLAEERAAKRQ